LASEEPSDEAEEVVTPEALSGLHAKLIIGEYGRQASMWIGSANATTAAIAGNIEFMVELQGTRSVLGIDQLLARVDDETSFADLLQHYTPPDSPVLPDPAQEQLENLVREVVSALARSNWSLTAEPAGPDQRAPYRVVLRRTHDQPLVWDAAVSVSAWLVSLRKDGAGRALASPYGGETYLGELSEDALTTLVAFEVVASLAGRECASQFALNVPLTGGPADRREVVLRSLLRDKTRVLRFLLFLLASDIDSIGDETDFFGSDGGGSGRLIAREDAPLLEALLRSLDREPAKLDTIESHITTLRADNETWDLLPDGFEEVWNAIWEARQELKS
jgi:hypothetical protein